MSDQYRLNPAVFKRVSGSENTSQQTLDSESPGIYSGVQSVKVVAIPQVQINISISGSADEIDAQLKVLKKYNLLPNNEEE